MSKKNRNDKNTNKKKELECQIESRERTRTDALLRIAGSLKAMEHQFERLLKMIEEVR